MRESQTEGGDDVDEGESDWGRWWCRWGRVRLREGMISTRVMTSNSGLVNEHLMCVYNKPWTLLHDFPWLRFCRSERACCRWHELVGQWLAKSTGPWASDFSNLLAPWASGPNCLMSRPAGIKKYQNFSVSWKWLHVVQISFVLWHMWMMVIEKGTIATITCQFGAFPFGARQFGACQFGAFHFDAIPVRRVSLWGDASLVRFTLARFPFLCLCWSSTVGNLVSFLRRPVWRA